MVYEYFSDDILRAINRVDEKVNKLTKEVLRMRLQLKNGPSFTEKDNLLPDFPLATKEDFLKLENDTKNSEFAEQLVSTF